MSYKLLKIIPGASKGIKLFRTSKFNRDGMPKIKPKSSKYRSSMFASYFIEHTRCAFKGHVPKPSGRKNHLPTCKYCYHILPEYGYGYGWTKELEISIYGEKDCRRYCENCTSGYYLKPDSIKCNNYFCGKERKYIINHA